MIVEWVVLFSIYAALTIGLVLLHRRAVRLEGGRARVAKTDTEPTVNEPPVPDKKLLAVFYHHVEGHLRDRWEKRVRDAPPDRLVTELRKTAHLGALALGGMPELGQRFLVLQERLESHSSGHRTMRDAEIQEAKDEVNKLLDALTAAAHRQSLQQLAEAPAEGEPGGPAHG